MTIKTFLNKAKGVEVSVNMLKNSRYIVTTYDIDDMVYLPERSEFLDRANAIRYAQRIAFGEAVPA